MAWAWTLLAVYLGIVAVCVAATMWRRAPTLIRGQSVLALTAVFTAVAVGTTLGTRQHSIPALAAWVVVLAGAIVARRKWLVTRQDAAGVAGELEGCARRLFITVAGASVEWRISVRGASLDIRLSPAGSLGTFLKFSPSSNHPKFGLFWKLLAKQYHAVIPAVRLRMR